MSKNILLFFILFYSISTLNSQELPINVDNEGAKKISTFKETSENYEKYFATKDKDKKGSGYKPFKRWEYHWSHYLQKDGTIAPAEDLWNAWEQKQIMSKAAVAISDWAPVGPFAQSSNSGLGRINTIAVDPNNSKIIYVGAPAGGLWRSTDDGLNWTPLTDHLPQIGISGIAIDPKNSNIIYISTGDDDAGDSYSIGVLKSIDGGLNWNQTGNINLGSYQPSSNEIIIDPSDSNKLWVGTSSGLFFTNNAGSTWERKLVGHIRDLKLKPGDSNTIYAVSMNSYYRSDNGGSTFSTILNDLPDSNTLGRLRIEVTPAAPNYVYILAAKTNWQFEGLYRSTNSGLNFYKTAESDDIFGSTQAWYDLALAVSSSKTNEIYVGVLDIWKSDNSGSNFTKINSWYQQTPSYTHADIHFLRFYNNILYAGTDGGVYRSDDGGNTFTDLSENLAISQFYRIAVSKQNSNKMAGGLQDNGGFSFSDNIWNNYHGGDGMDSASDPNDENTFYGFTQNGGSLTVTNNSGINSLGVASAPTGETGNWVTPLVVNKGSDLYAGYSQLYKLGNRSWIQLSDFNFEGNLENIEIDPSNNDNIFVSVGTTLYKSTDKGITFTKHTSSKTGIKGSFISSIEIHNSNSNIIWLTTAGVNPQSPSSGDIGGGVFKSTDGGTTFTDISFGLPAETKFVVRHHPFSTNNSIYVGTALGVYHRNDDTGSWEVFSTNLPNVAIPDLEINPYDNTITAATYGRSVWQASIPTISLPLIDIDLLKVDSADNFLSCGGDITPKIKVLNNGVNNITSFLVNYNIDGGDNQVYNWSGSLASNDSETIILPPFVAVEGTHMIAADIVLSNDENQYNNSSSQTFTITINQTGEGQYINTFGDINADTWIVSDDNLWEIGSPNTANLNALVASGYVTNPTGNYPDQTTSTLISPCYNLTNLQDPVLKFKMAFDLEENWDVIYIEYSTDQGENWNILGNANDPNWYNSDRTNASSGPADDCQNCPGAQWTGLDKTLKEYSYDLTTLNGESNIIFRFKFVSDYSVNEEGVVIDDFQIEAKAVLTVNDFEEGEFLIYPNPSSDIFNIRRMNTTGENMSIKVYDLMGKLISQDENINDANYKLNLKGVSKGIYFLQVKINNKRMVKKLVLN